MALYRNTYRIESARLRSWDYASPGLYFVTICTKDRIPWFGAVTEGQMRLSEVGRLVNAEWHRMGYIRHDVELDAWVVMPDHVHGIIQLIHCEPTVVRRPFGASHMVAYHIRRRRRRPERASLLRIRWPRGDRAFWVPSSTNSKARVPNEFGRRWMATLRGNPGSTTP